MWILLLFFLIALAIQAIAMQSQAVPAATTSNGFANGWTVLQGKRTLCRNPFIDAKRKRIECS